MNGVCVCGGVGYYCEFDLVRWMVMVVVGCRARVLSEGSEGRDRKRERDGGGWLLLMGGLMVGGFVWGGCTTISTRRNDSFAVWKGKCARFGFFSGRSNGIFGMVVGFGWVVVLLDEWLVWHVCWHIEIT